MELNLESRRIAMKRSKFRQSAHSFTHLRMGLCAFSAAVLFSLPACTLWQPGIWDGSAELLSLKTGGKPLGSAAAPAEMRHSSSTLSHQSRDTISLSVEFRHVSVDVLDEDTWSRIDETAFEPQVRQAWLGNGLRIGLISLNDHELNPDATNAVASDPINSLLAGAEVLGKKADGREVIPLRPAHRHELPLSPPLQGEQVVLLKKKTGLIGQRFESPQFLLALTANRGPREGQATLELRPEIHHGAVRQQFVSSDTAVRIHAGRERWELLEMNLSWISRADTALMIAPAVEGFADEPTFGLGRQMLRDDQHMEDDQHLIALIQLQP